MLRLKKEKGSDGMRGGYGRDRRFRVGLIIFVIFLIGVFLVSCMAGSGTLLAGGLFLNTSAAREEQVLREHAADGARAAELSAALEGAVGASTTLPTFRGAQEGARLLREGLLFGMLADAYSTYVGNPDSIARTREAYPNTNFLVLIPAADVESRMVRTLGTAGTHASTGAFVYLDRVGMYTTAAPHLCRDVAVTVSRLTETENTYRMIFTLSDGRATSQAYVAVFEKSDGGCVLTSLNEAN